MPRIAGATRSVLVTPRPRGTSRSSKHRLVIVAVVGNSGFGPSHWTSTPNATQCRRNHHGLSIYAQHAVDAWQAHQMELLLVRNRASHSMQRRAPSIGGGSRGGGSCTTPFGGPGGNRTPVRHASHKLPTAISEFVPSLRAVKPYQDASGSRLSRTAITSSSLGPADFWWLLRRIRPSSRHQRIISPGRVLRGDQEPSESSILCSYLTGDQAASPLDMNFSNGPLFGCGEWIRTTDRRLIGPSLYQLSYSAIWSVWQELNLRPLGSKPRTLPG